MVAFTSYFFYTYILLPIVWKSLQLVYKKRYDLCPLFQCIQPLGSCFQDASCKAWIDEVATCRDPNSKSRQIAAQVFQHVQHPENPAYCQYQSFDTIVSNTALEFLECVGKSHCLPPSEYPDICATMEGVHVLPLDPTISEILPGRWFKVYTTGWDLWPCQWTDFWAPGNTTSTAAPPPDDWMTAWPHDAAVWRMDLYWKNKANSSLTFHMDNEMYVGETWEFGTGGVKTTATAPASLKTRAVMWGTEAHENWYILDYHTEWNMMMIYYCAYTEAVNAFDSMAMVLKKQDPSGEDEATTSRGTTSSVSVTLTDEQTDYYERNAKELLGGVHGRLQRIQPCQ